jgi:single-strand DNA-binding protein
MAGWAQTIIVGNVGRDVTFKYTQSGVAVADFSVAVTTRRGSAENRTEKTVWYRVTAWRTLGEVANQYVKKGQQIMVVGTVEVNAFMGKDGTPQASLELTADNFQLLGRRDDAMGSGERSSGDFGAPPSDMSDIPF